MYLNAKLIPKDKDDIRVHVLFPNLDEGDLSHPDKLLWLLSKRIPVNCTELDVENNGPVELLLATIQFCHEHDISVAVGLTKYQPLDEPDAAFRRVISIESCPSCGGRFSVSYNHRCPHCGGWGYEPHIERSKKLMFDEQSD